MKRQQWLYGSEQARPFKEFPLDLVGKFEELINVTTQLDAGVIDDEELRSEYAVRFTDLAKELHVPPMFVSIAIVDDKIRVYH